MARHGLPIAFVVAGLLVMGATVFGFIPGEARVIGLGFGFLVVVAGLVIGVSRSLSQRGPGSEEEGANRALRFRVLFAGAALVSLALPYLRVPLSEDAPMATGIELVQAFASGYAAFAVTLGAVFVGLLVASVFISVVTDLGGALLFLGGLAAVVLVQGNTGLGMVAVILGVLGPGFYVATVAALGIFATRFVDAEGASRSDWSPIHR